MMGRAGDVPEMLARAAACKGGGSFTLWLETTVKGLSSPDETWSLSRACPRERVTFPFQAKPKGFYSLLCFPASPQTLPPGPLQAAQPPPACVGVGCQQGPS